MTKNTNREKVLLFFFQRTIDFKMQNDFVLNLIK